MLRHFQKFPEINVTNLQEKDTQNSIVVLFFLLGSHHFTLQVGITHITSSHDRNHHLAYFIAGMDDELIKLYSTSQFI